METGGESHRKRRIMPFIDKNTIASRKDVAGNGLTKNELLDIIEKIDAEKSAFRSPFGTGEDRQKRKTRPSPDRGRNPI